MEILDRLTVTDGPTARTIELVHGDITAMDPDDAVDIVVVSAFRGDYTPIPGTLIGALEQRGVSVAELARDKAVDLRETSSCWLSKELRERPAGISFRRILCFEPAEPGRAPLLVGDIFRALVPLLPTEGRDSDVVLPLVTAGNMGADPTQVIESLLAAATNWLALGLPVRQLRIFVLSEERARLAREAFARWRDSHDLPVLEPTPGPAHDAFISYSRSNRPDVDFLVDELSRRGLRSFLDKRELDAGAAWQQEIYEAVNRSRRFVALYSPEYLRSKMCQEEYNIARLRSRQGDSRLLFPIFLYNVALPPHVAVVQYEDCREGDRKKLVEACAKLAAGLAR